MKEAQLKRLQTQLNTSSTIFWIDPPSGWKFGFPKKIDLNINSLGRKWLIANGVPEKDVEFIKVNTQIANDYGTYLIEAKILQAIRGGKCGPATRKWVGKAPTLDLAVSLIDKFNKRRKIDREKKGNNESIYSMLISVGVQLENIQKAINKSKIA